MNVFPNGDIVFPMKGNPPTKEIPGYTQDPFEPFIYHLNLVDCKYQEKDKNYRMPCGKYRKVLWCNLFNKETNALVCKECTKREY